MAALNTGSELLETELTPQEVNTAMQFKDTHLSIAYLQNSRVAIFRNLAGQEFTDPKDDAENHRIRAFWKGQLDILGILIDGALNPTPVPVEQTAMFSPNGTPSQES